MNSSNSVYIIDDDSITIFGLRKLLMTLNSSLKIEEFKNGKQALDAIQQVINNNAEAELPKIIFLDLNMPVMDGWMFLDEFLRLSDKVAHIHIKIMTSSIDYRDQEKWQYYLQKTSNYIDFITKPIHKLNLEGLTQNVELAS